MFRARTFNASLAMNAALYLYASVWSEDPGVAPRSPIKQRKRTPREAQMPPGIHGCLSSPYICTNAYSAAPRAPGAAMHHQASYRTADTPPMTCLSRTFWKRAHQPLCVAKDASPSCEAATVMPAYRVVFAAVKAARVPSGFFTSCEMTDHRGRLAIAWSSTCRSPSTWNPRSISRSDPFGHELWIA